MCSTATTLVHLTPTEFDLLAYLARAPAAVFTREQLLAEVWGYHDGAGARTVDSHVRALRRKLGNDVVRTVHGVGYAAGDHPTRTSRRDPPRTARRTRSTTSPRSSSSSASSSRPRSR